MSSFELDGCQHAKRRVPTLAIVPDLEKLEDSGGQLDPGLPPTRIQELDLQPAQNDSITALS